VTLGPGHGLIAVLCECGRPGWTVPADRFEQDWPGELQRYKDQGADFVALYWDSKASLDQRGSLVPLIETLPIVAHQTGPIRQGRPTYEYALFRLEPEGLHRLSLRGGESNEARTNR
jgi:hypothetical protein